MANTDLFAFLESVTTVGHMLENNLYDQLVRVVRRDGEMALRQPHYYQLMVGLWTPLGPIIIWLPIVFGSYRTVCQELATAESTMREIEARLSIRFAIDRISRADLAQQSQN